MAKQKIIPWFLLQKIFNLLASLELAVFVILSVAFCSAWGTIYEARYGVEVAQAMVYRSWWFTAVLFLFLLNVLFAALSRFPWKRHHIGFLVTHLGIILILIGSIITRHWGVDGSVVLGEGESADRVRLEERTLHIFLATGEKNYDHVWTKALSIRPNLPKFWEISTKTEEKIRFQWLNLWPHARRVVGVELKEGLGVPAVKFRLQGSEASMEQWLFLNGSSSIDLGPAVVHFQKGKPNIGKAPLKRTLYIYFIPGEKVPRVALGTPGNKTLAFRGPVHYDQSLKLGWMDFRFFLEEFYLQAVPQTKYVLLEREEPGSVEAIEIDLNGERRWLELNSAIQFSRGGKLFYVQYTKKQVPLGFSILLKKFEIAFYPGSTRPKSYQSLVKVGDKEIMIRMNEPLSHQGFTFYQSSYSTNLQGEPVVSILSVNMDPGRWIKYVGCIMLVFGIVLMFYFLPIYSGKNKFLSKKWTKK